MNLNFTLKTTEIPGLGNRKSENLKRENFKLELTEISKPSFQNPKQNQTVEVLHFYPKMCPVKQITLICLSTHVLEFDLLTFILLFNVL